ncbi:MAG: hypothetical protein QG608_1912 [Actinomycetota bacterium]|nr:hypothetical protein [Actinomycetota bacterium]
MDTELARQPGTRLFDLEELVQLAADGRVRVPHFQRSFRWELRDAQRLFDSILRGYPVGSLLLWQRPAPAARLHLGALELEVPQRDTALWVVDGQQRITSIVNALAPDGYRDQRFGLDYDLTKKELVARRNSETSRSIPLPVLFDLRQLLAWFGDHPELADHVSEANHVATSLRKFEIPAYIVDRAEPEVLRDIFDRMNNYGKRLSRAEVFSALFAPQEDRADQSLTFTRIAESIDVDLDFGLIDDDTVLRAVLARRGPDVGREIRIEFAPERRVRGDFPDESRDEAYANGEIALRRAVQFLREEVGVPHFSFLPYRYLLVVLTRFLAHHPDPSPRNRELLRRWFWRSALQGPTIFKGNVTGAMRIFGSQIQPSHESRSVQGLLKHIEDRSSGNGPSYDLPGLRRLRTHEASSRIVLSALWSLGPRSIPDGEPSGTSALASALQGRGTAADIVTDVVPRRLVPSDKRLSAANRIIHVPTDGDSYGDVREALGALRSKDSRLRHAVLVSHALSEETLGLLSAGDHDAFLRSRERIVNRVVEGFLHRMMAVGFEDTPPLADLTLDEDLDDDLDEESERDDLGGAM